MSKQKIDVGAGYRRLGNFEVLREGDERLYCDGKWRATMDAGTQVCHQGGAVYRRRLPDPILEVVGRLKNYSIKYSGMIQAVVKMEDLEAAVKWIEEHAK